MDIQGHCDERFAAVRDAFAQNFSERGDVGASFAATIDGEFVVDIWAGHRNADKSLPWEKDTIVTVYSTSKTMTFFVALLLADRGDLDFDAPVARYWPEFAANGKDGVLVKHLLSHSAGLPGFASIDTAEALYDWERCIEDLAGQAPWWEPGSQSGYHSLTQGFLIGEVVRRITGQSYGQFLATEVAGPLDADFHVGLDPAHFERVGELIADPQPPAMPEIDPSSLMARVFPFDVGPAVSNSPRWRQAEVPAGNGHGNARSVVKIQSVLANGGTAFGKSLLSEATCRRAGEIQTSGTDAVLQIPATYALGYGVVTEQMQSTLNPGTLYWGGMGGSTITVDRERRICCAYVMNQMKSKIIGDSRGAPPIQALYSCLA